METEMDLMLLVKYIRFNELVDLANLVDLINDSEENLAKQLILPMGELLEEKGSALWEECSVILSLIRFDKVLPNFDLLLEWYQDINWPGAIRITEVIKYHRSEIDIEIIEGTIRKAKDVNDYSWLTYLKFLLEELEFLDDKYLSKDIRKIIDCVEKL